MAKRFKFTLQPVLEQRKRLEEEKQTIVAQRARAVEEAEYELKRLNDEFRRHSDELRNDHRQLDGETLRMHYAHLQFLDRVIVSQIHLVADRRIALDRARGDLLAASKERKVVEKLKERRLDAHVLEEQRVEQNALDDSNARRHGRATSFSGGTTP